MQTARNVRKSESAHFEKCALSTCSLVLLENEVAPVDAPDPADAEHACDKLEESNDEGAAAEAAWVGNGGDHGAGAGGGEVHHGEYEMEGGVHFEHCARFEVFAEVLHIYLSNYIQPL